MMHLTYEDMKQRNQSQNFGSNPMMTSPSQSSCDTTIVRPYEVYSRENNKKDYKVCNVRFLQKRQSNDKRKLALKPKKL